MDFKKFEESITAYIDGELSKEDKIFFEQKLESDKKCMTKFNQMIELIDDIKQMPQLNTSSLFSRNLQTKINSNSKSNYRISKQIKSIFFESKPVFNFSLSFAAIAIFTFLYLNNLDVFSPNMKSVEFSKTEDQNSEYFEIELAGGTDEEFDEEFEFVDSNEDSVLEKNNGLKFNFKGLFDSVVNQVNTKRSFKDQE
ncbi:MAG: hypothetical protein CMG76_02295 [Candidatus Marinimicrobia bacterium]|nr:hypothetical protein [Candidatus Neomarinimicrobiota bacterium]|tara:strand:+ start:454 stop:1044 length:591 start_codon:yes stop_codon:yes gene_type:complete